MGESTIPLPKRVDTEPTDDLTGRAIGLEVAGIMRYHLSVLDREDRLESGTGDWRSSFFGDRTARSEASREAVLRTLALAVDPRYYPILEALVGPGHLRTSDLAGHAGVGRLTLHERVSDLVSAGLATKVPEADQVSVTAAGAVVVELVREATAVAARDLEEGG